MLQSSSHVPEAILTASSTRSTASSVRSPVQGLPSRQFVGEENRPNSTSAAHRPEIILNMDQPVSDPHAVDLTRPPDSAPSASATDLSDHRSLSTRFEDFLGQVGHRSLCNSKLVLFGEPSPLTFALKLQKGIHSDLHDASQRALSSDSLAVVEDNVHPEHLHPHDVDCLKAKGAFIYPEPNILEEMINAFLEHFYPLYSVVDPIDLRKAQQERKLPWILLHSVCFVAMTFCEPPLIYKAGFSSRAQARKAYYDRAKALFDFNYENRKIVLVKVAILLSFKGPQMDCYWNPCSWIEIGVTMAVAMGLHRRYIAMSGNSRDKGLLRRLWWTLVVRDAHCSALLGRPFRINMSQVDIEMLAEDDFPDVHTCRSQTTSSSCNCRQSIEYQIQATKLSLILRGIMFFRFGPTSGSSTTNHIHEQLDRWKSQLPPIMQCHRGQFSTSFFALQLEILLNYHIMLLHMDRHLESKPNDSSLPTTMSSSYNSTAITESAALAVLSSAIKLMTRTSISDVPHEVFPGFFVAGIVLYQQAHRMQDNHFASMVRASFDNCQMLLSQAQNTWDPGVWAMRVFEFLLFVADAADAAEATRTSGDTHGYQPNTTSLDTNTTPYTQPSHPMHSDMESSIWSDIPNMEFDRNVTMDLAEYMLLPNFFTAPFGN
ncbi:transcriptional regulator family: Fungal Specific TF [Aspergillus niger]|nr:transcriptional regulator family: Fungal Specific TF [Aspergillus niger]KAI2915157.1 transcriptional regulator family: Fungal Specific TF [Aspergillus niger]KAI2969781.1 transcriptional regulator family: Fungal Specific TF [Aspergillus niger]KAI2990045.1 transcriptional regulator family: Fungal Specific TF [Aspergillus niger]KAI3056333.1 transcriptional regulator family: Fungal Specific TF [Aspergillus niger]